jgi:hypothetical protein
MVPMTDEQVLAHYRVKHANPYMTLRSARALEALALKHAYLHKQPQE